VCRAVTNPFGALPSEGSLHALAMRDVAITVDIWHHIPRVLRADAASRLDAHLRGTLGARLAHQHGARIHVLLSC